jgi:acyl carrier protein
VSTDITQRVNEIVRARYGRTEENLMASGLVDSLRAVELAMLLEKAFGLEADTFSLSDLKTVSAITRRVRAVPRR